MFPNTQPFLDWILALNEVLQLAMAMGVPSFDQWQLR